MTYTFLPLRPFPVYSIERDFNSETKDSNIEDSREMTSKQTTPKKVDGLGPMTREGMPLAMRSVSSKTNFGSCPMNHLWTFFESLQEVTDMNRDLWYKKMYNTIHKAKDDGNAALLNYVHEKNCFRQFRKRFFWWELFVLGFRFTFHIDRTFVFNLLTLFFILVNKISHLQVCDESNSSSSQCT